MLRKLSRRLTYANVVATLALFVAVGTGGAYAANTVFSTDIVDGEVKSVDIANNSIHSGDVLDNTINTFDVHSFLGVDVVDETLTGADVDNNSLTGDDILNGSLDAPDIGERSLFHFEATIGTVNATSCVNRFVTGIPALGDQLLLTPDVDTAHGALIYDARYDIDADRATIHVCNFSNAAINDGTTNFNLLVINT